MGSFWCGNFEASPFYIAAKHREERTNKGALKYIVALFYVCPPSRNKLETKTTLNHNNQTGRVRVFDGRNIVFQNCIYCHNHARFACSKVGASNWETPQRAANAPNETTNFCTGLFI